MKNLIFLGIVLLIGIQAAKAQTVFEGGYAHNPVVTKKQTLPVYQKFEYEFVYKVSAIKGEIDLKLGKKKAAASHKSWIARNLGVRKISVAWRNATPLNNTYANSLHWFRIFKFLPKAREIFQVNTIANP